MKYQNIAAALGWTETPDTAEGLFLQPEEAATIDASIAEAALNVQAATDLSAANDRLVQLSGELTNEKLATSNAIATIAERDATIAALKAENDKLGGESSGDGTALVTGGDLTATEGEKKLGLSDPNHPLNVEATRRVAAAKANRK